MRRKRGANAIEFALTVPIIIALLAGVVDYGWMFQQQLALQNATRDGVRAGSVTPPDSSPIALAQDTAEAALIDSGVDPLAVDIDVTFEGLWPDERIRVTTEMPYEPLIGMVPLPTSIGSTLAMRLENQVEP